MDKQEVTDAMKVEIIHELVKLQNKLIEDVDKAFLEGGEEGKYRLKVWIKAFNRFAEKKLPNELKETDHFLSNDGYRSTSHLDDDNDVYRRVSGDKIHAYLKSLLQEIRDGEYDFAPINKEVKEVETTADVEAKAKTNKVLIVHGHDEAAKYRTEAFLRKHGFEPIILHLNASKGDTIIQKLERLAKDVSFGIVLYTPDDMGESKSKAAQNELLPRARQNVIFEHGYLMGLIGRPNVAAIVEGHVEKPGDIDGVVYISSRNWEIELLRELREAEYTIDAANL
ncbi:TIR domain-containing protein [Shewanella frigidimarina]|uniref:TIR domain-containing protein n=1 Tax=Shewanella frigidimarina TaxID=56812 RepID=UPI003D7B2236